MIEMNKADGATFDLTRVEVTDPEDKSTALLTANTGMLAVIAAMSSIGFSLTSFPVESAALSDWIQRTNQSRVFVKFTGSGDWAGEHGASAMVSLQRDGTWMMLAFLERPVRL